MERERERCQASCRFDEMIRLGVELDAYVHMKDPSTSVQFLHELLPQVIDKAFGFDIAVEEAQCAINAAHVESDSIENGIGLVKLMGHYSGYIAMYGTLASRDVDCCLIPESPFYLKGPGGLFNYIEKRL